MIPPCATHTESDFGYSNTCVRCGVSYQRLFNEALASELANPRQFMSVDRTPKTSAASRTLFMFPELNEPPKRGPSIRTLEQRLHQAALQWYRNLVGYEEVLYAAKALDEATA